MITAIDDASEAEHIKALLRVDILRDGWSTVRVGRTPHPLAFDVFLVVDGAEHYVTNLNLAAERMNVFYFQLPKWVSGDRVGIVFRPSARAARFSVDLTQYWNGTIEFKDLPVQKN